MKLRRYFNELRITLADRRRLRRLFSADLEFTQIFDDNWSRRRRMTKAGGRYTPRRTL